MTARQRCEILQYVVTTATYAFTRSNFRVISLASPLGPTFIPSLDTYLAHARSNTFINQELAVHSSTDPAAENGATSSLNHGDLFEIQGPSGSGKTQLSLFLLMTSILPDKVKFRLGDLSKQTSFSSQPKDGVHELDLGGKSQTAIFIHPSTHPSPVLRLAKLITSHVKNCLPPSYSGINEEMQAELARRVVQRSLSRLTVFQVPLVNASFIPSDFSSPYAPLAATLAFIPHQVRRSNRELGLLIIDGIGDGFWQARWQREQRMKENKRKSGAQAGIKSSENVSMDDIVKRIDKIRRDFGCAIIMTNQAIWKPLDDKNQVSSTNYWSQHLPPPYPSPFEAKAKRSDNTATLTKSQGPYWPLTAHITLLPVNTSIRQMRPDVLLYEVLRKGGEGDKREQARMRARSRGLVRLAGQLSEEQVGEFSFAVKDEEIETW